MKKYKLSEKTRFWKLGTNWGKKKPSFFKVLEQNNVVISKERFYGIDDLILVTKGFDILAVALVKSKPIPLISSPKLFEELTTNYNIYSSQEIFCYETEFYTLPTYDIFQYPQQKGMCEVNQVEIKEQARAIWEKRPIPDYRLMRLTWNTNNWEYPSGHKWSKSKQGSTESYSKQYGYGHEEWLFNDRYNFVGYQYGYIRGVSNLPEKQDAVDEVFLFTIAPDKQCFLIGSIKDVEVITGWEEQELIAEELIKASEEQMLEELEEVGADYQHHKDHKLALNMRFKWEDADILEVPKPVDFIDLGIYKRYQAFKLESEMKRKLQEETEGKPELQFKSGKPVYKSHYERKSTAKQTLVHRTHSDIGNELYDYLKEVKGIDASNISLENTTIGRKTIDLTVKERETLSLFEIKTSADPLSNIRQAIGQLLEYALLDNNVKIKKLIIVGPSPLNTTAKNYFDRLCETIQIPLEYWEYDSDSERIESRFNHG